jgi:tetratricopeptide (TPR) repeat protein
MALDHFINALEMLRRILPDEHSDIAGCLWSTGIVYARQKDYDAALPCYFDALKISDKVFPVGHKTTSKLFFLIVCIYIEKEDYEGALHICQQKLNDIREVLGGIHPSIGNLFLQIGDILRKYCNNDEALLYYEKALTIFYHCNPPELYDITHSLSHIALLQEENQNFQLALDNYMKELEIKQKLYLVDQPRTGYTLRNIGRIFLKLWNITWQGDGTYRFSSEGDKNPVLGAYNTTATVGGVQTYNWSCDVISLIFVRNNRRKMMTT